ncbi:ATP-binding protein [Nocardia colli]|uniref:ATP-binding protein n=1 Tax=Nocardia colli TaxID=2545717 RepID=A0A5N0DN25_9NOCA|nr:ATP-binding protein [Nocardia colli]KAA8877319.1 ATP-binding protein [Nocardia colli]
MSGRMALVVGSECDALPRLGCVEELATALYSKLNEFGGWESAWSRPGPLLSPSATELISALEAAFAAAAKCQATLLISFVGHGVATGAENYYLMARDSRFPPASSHALHLVQVLSEQLDQHRVDGLIVLVDACEAQDGVVGATRRLTDRVDLAAQRMELLVASGRHSAYDGCFTRTMLAVFEHGLPARGENLLPVYLLDPLQTGCPLQVPGHFGVAYGGDPGLWLVPNISRRDDAVWNRPMAGLVDALTDGVIVTDTLRRCVVDVYNTTHLRLRGVIGLAGSGKSTLLSLLIRPNVLGRGHFTADYVAAAAFVSIATSMESLSEELSQQLSRRIPGFALAAEAALTEVSQSDENDTFDVMVIEPLARIDTFGLPVTIVIDGIDQAETGTFKLIEFAIEKLVRRVDLAHVRVIVGVRTGHGIENRSAFSEMYRVLIPPPTVEELAKAVAAAHTRVVGDQDPAEWVQRVERLLNSSDAGGWLLARLLTELDTETVLHLRTGVSVGELVTHRIRQVIRR